MLLSNVFEFIRDFRHGNPTASKQQISAATVQAFRLKKYGAVYACDVFAIRFSTANTPSFSGTVAALKWLEHFNSVPFIVAVVRPNRTEFLLANATFIKKVSHSSQILMAGRVRGSFNGSDVVRDYEGLENCPENFEELFARHQEFTWEENLERLVEATGQISGIGRRFSPTPDQREAILASPSLAASLVVAPEYVRLKRELASIVSERSPVILEHAHLDNVNQRGNLIEQAITGGINEHNLADMVRSLAGQIEMQIEIKTKLMDRASSPKAYNIDKALETLGRGNTLIAFCFVGIQRAVGRVTASTVSIFDRTVLAATRTQPHWSGRNTRGHMQLTGDFARVFSPDYRESIDTDAAVTFLKYLLDI